MLHGKADERLRGIEEKNKTWISGERKWFVGPLYRTKMCVYDLLTKFNKILNLAKTRDIY